MDINSLLSPQETPRATPTPPQKPSPRKAQHKRLKSNALTSSAHNVAQNPEPYVALPPQRPGPAPLPPHNRLSGSRSSITSTPSAENVRPYRQPSTAGMDTLAELASMQHDQQTARANAAALRNAESRGTPELSSTAILPNLGNLTRSEATSVLRAGSFDMKMADSPQRSPPLRTYFSKSLSEPDLQAVTEAGNYILQNPHAYEKHVVFISLLHKGLRNHISQYSSAPSSRMVGSYELLNDLRNARESMSLKFAMGEELWADWLQDEIDLANNFEDRIKIRELCEKAVGEENTSSKLWLVYGQWMLSESHQLAKYSDRSSGGQTTTHSPYASEEELSLAFQIFSQGEVLNIWKRGAEETMWRINDSDQLWDPYTDLLLQDMRERPNPQVIPTMQDWFMDRLRMPHATWDQTSSKFSTFISTYNNANWEDIMVTANRLGADAKRKYELRESREADVLRAQESGDPDAELSVYRNYIDYELGLSRQKRTYSVDLANAIFQRATLRFPASTALWEDYAIWLHDEINQLSKSDGDIRDFLQRATSHCPWSGTLWSELIIAAEIEQLPFSDIEDIKHKATSSGLLETGEMAEALKTTTAWCGYLRRRAFLPGASDEEMDVAEVGIRSAIEDLETIGVKKYGKDYAGDPGSRLETIYITYLTQAAHITQSGPAGNFDAARDNFRKLIRRKGHDYEFWLRFYHWEMTIWFSTASHLGPRGTSKKPIEATKVLQQALRRTDLNWPEKILQTYLEHCEDHEDAEQLQKATVEYWKQTSALKKRREQEAYAQYAAQQQTQAQAVLHPVPTPPGSDAKQKRKAEPLENGPSKKSRSDLMPTVETPTIEVSSGDLGTKRDRENTTIVVRNLPVRISDVKVRQFFRDCGKLKSLQVIHDNEESSTAFIEFETKEDVEAALTRDQKTLEGSTVRVEVGTGSTLYVCNFPPTADDSWLRGKFSKFGHIVDIRFPSLKYNTHRRFAYVQYDTVAGAQAALQLNGERNEGDLSLSVAISDPAHKQDRHGAMAEGREIFVANLPLEAKQQDLKKHFREYGVIESARVPKKLNGDSKGIGFVVFRSSDDAQKALSSDQSDFNGRKIKVARSTNDPKERQAALASSRSPRSTASPAPRGTAQPRRRDSDSQPNHDKKADIAARTTALLNLPDTMNDARVRALAEQYGELVRVVLRPDHQGAILEFKDQASVGKAALALEGHEIAPGRNLRIGTIEELKSLQAERKPDTEPFNPQPRAAKSSLPAPNLVRRPAAGVSKRGGRGGRGGLGAKHSGGGLDGDRAKTSGSGTEAGVKGQENGEDVRKPKSNADFKSMFLGK